MSKIVTIEFENEKEAESFFKTGIPIGAKRVDIGDSASKDDIVWMTKVCTQYARSKSQYSVHDRANDIRVKYGLEKVLL